MIFSSATAIKTAPLYQIVESLQSKGAKCWFAPNEAIGRYAKDIVHAIRESKVFLLCLSENSATSDQVLNEIETCYAQNKRREGNPILIEPLCIGEINIDDPIFDEINYYIRRINFIMPSSPTPSNIATEVMRVCNHALGIKKKPEVERFKSGYYTNEYELNRLNLQGKFALKFDSGIYEKVLSKYESPVVLDVGCSRGDLIIDRLQRFTKQFTLLGIDRNEVNINLAKEKYQKDNINFLQIDLESSDFMDELIDGMDNLGIEKFDVINFSMVLLHIQNVGRTLRKFRRLLKDDGYIVVIDIDDGFNMYYPDPNGLFKKLDELFLKDKSAGNRYTGRELYSHLIAAGYSKVSMEKFGRSTANFTEEEKKDYYIFNFEYIIEDYKEMLAEDPTNTELAYDLEWLEENMPEILNLYNSPEFCMFDGKIGFIAQK